MWNVPHPGINRWVQRWEGLERPRVTLEGYLWTGLSITSGSPGMSSGGRRQPWTHTHGPVGAHTTCTESPRGAHGPRRVKDHRVSSVWELKPRPAWVTTHRSRAAVYLARLGVHGPDGGAHLRLPGKARPSGRLPALTHRSASVPGGGASGAWTEPCGARQAPPRGRTQHAEPLLGLDATPPLSEPRDAGLLLMALLPSPVCGSGRTDHVLG